MMSDISDISEHPKYNGFEDRGVPFDMGLDTPEELFQAPPDPNLPESLLAFEAFQADVQAEMEEVLVAPTSRPVAMMSVCRGCMHTLDRRSKWKQRFMSPCPQDLVCSESPLTKTTHPVTGETAYVMGSLLSPGVLAADYQEPYASCESVNPCGACQKFKPVIYYHR
jgi:hypothetical protein